MPFSVTDSCFLPAGAVRTKYVFLPQSPDQSFVGAFSSSPPALTVPFPPFPPFLPTPGGTTAANTFHYLLVGCPESIMPLVCDLQLLKCVSSIAVGLPSYAFPFCHPSLSGGSRTQPLIIIFVTASLPITVSQTANSFPHIIPIVTSTLPGQRRLTTSC